MHTLKLILEVVVCFLVSVLSIAFALVPVMIYQIYGGTDTNIDFLLRVIGFLMVCATFYWWFNRTPGTSKKE